MQNLCLAQNLAGIFIQECFHKKNQICRLSCDYALKSTLLLVKNQYKCYYSGSPKIQPIYM